MAVKFGIVGLGVVGRHMETDIQRAGHPYLKYDIVAHGLVEQLTGFATREEMNTCDAVFVCVSTPEGADGQADLSAIDDVFGWLRVPVAIIRSTVPPGTTAEIQNRLIEEHPDYDVAFVPEFIGEGVNAPYNAMKQPPFLIVGAFPESWEPVCNALAQLYNAECEFIRVLPTTAEVAKYAENYFLALKVTWANELYDICNAVGADFGQMMAAVTHDYRIGRSHTHVYPDSRGWGGRCLPKDTAAILARVGEDTAPLLAAVRRVNERQRMKAEGGRMKV